MNRQDLPREHTGRFLQKTERFRPFSAGFFLALRGMLYYNKKVIKRTEKEAPP
jgi:hypothetical protein